MSAILPTATIAAAGTVIGSSVRVPADAMYLLLEGKFLYGAGGTSVKAYVQTRISGGNAATWRDIAQFAFLLASVTKWHAVSARTALAAAIVVSDAALADDTILSGFIGDELRVKYVSVGTYSGATSLSIDASFKK